MQVPEKLSLIGGSILLASTLVFTLKSQASQILPKVNNGVSEMFKSDQERKQDQQQAQADQAFNNNFQQAQQKGWKAGQWGSAKFYVDDQGNMHVGAGQLSGPVENLFGTNWLQNNIKTINLDEDVQAPQGSSYLFSTESTTGDLQNITHLDHLDTSHVTDMADMFGYDSNLQSLDLSHFDTHNVTNMYSMFYYDNSLNNLDLNHFDTSHVTNMYGMFDMDNINQLTLGSDTKLQDSSNTYLSSDDYRSNGQTSNLGDGNAHPGTWVKQ